MDKEEDIPVTDPVKPGENPNRSRLHRLFCYKWWTILLWTLLGVLVALAVVAGVLLGVKPWRPQAPKLQLASSDLGWPFVSAEWLAERMAEEGGVTVLDARAPPSALSNQAGLDLSIPGSIRSQWSEFMSDGELMSPVRIQEIFRAKNVRNDRPVVVVGGWNADNYWGEEARIFWQLYWLNHTNAHILFGGIWSWDSTVHQGSGARGVGDFTAQAVASRRIEFDELVDTVRTDSDSLFIVDARQPREYNGAAPFGSAYGGRIPGAQSLWWKDAFDADGNLLSREEIQRRMAALGYSADKRTVTYCTRGIRASFTTAVLLWSGFDVALYEGSWLDWTSRLTEEETDQLLVESGAAA